MPAPEMPSAEGPSVGAKLPEGNYGMEVAWTRDLGSGYSHVWIVDGKAVPPTVTFSGVYPARCGPHGLLRSVHPSDWHFYGGFRALWEAGARSPDRTS